MKDSPDHKAFPGRLELGSCLSLFVGEFHRDRGSIASPYKRVSIVRDGYNGRANVYCLKPDCKNDERESVRIAD